MTRIIGITGGLGTGKSTVEKFLQQQQIPVWDADRAARRAVAPATPAYRAIVERFGPSILLEDGELNRAQLGASIFADPNMRHWLEALIHPQVEAEARAWLAAVSRPTVALVVPLLFEAGMTGLVTEVWVVFCTPEQQRARILSRDPLTPEAVEQRLASQWPLLEKVKRADVVLDNQGDFVQLQAQVAHYLGV
ncbi:dephospho-CoA kinase [Anthocerotibacter panamensis]|uniref:dephospho-CoA kinase n=1 Tax=Anthocerotibacter panamensis TaxID=2857077 RepID=UPI001C408228|nr:dephospho-CoA kinase [Anthocerotibacter panamensis]